MKVLFMPGEKKVADAMWSPICEEKCARYGFEPVLAALDESARWKQVLPDADFVLTSWGSPVFSSELLKQAPKLRMLGHAAGSVKTVTDETTYKAGLRVSTANAIMARSVAEWALMALMMGSRNVCAYANFGGLRPMNWKRSFEMGNLRSQTVGIWGLGDTARHLLAMLRPLKPGRILIASAHASPGEIQAQGAEKVDFAELLTRSDLLLLLAGVTPENFGRIGAKELKMLHDGAVLINCGRAWLTQEQPLYAELKTGRIRAILDVYHQEPFPPDSPLQKWENVILTPHNAGYPGRGEFIPFLLDEFHRFLQGEKLLGEVSAARFRTMTQEHRRK